MKAFDEKETCPKCGGGAISTWYHDRATTPQEVTAHMYWPKNLPRPPRTHRICDGTSIDEHLHRKCERCRFEWLEDVLRAEAQ